MLVIKFQLEVQLFWYTYLDLEEYLSLQLSVGGGGGRELVHSIGFYDLVLAPV